MKRKVFTNILTAVLMSLTLTAVPLSANAATPDEAAEYARSIGIPEEFIQQGWNAFHSDPEKYPPEVIDSYIEVLKGMSEETIAQLIIDNGSGTSQVETPSTPASQQTPAAAPDNSGNSGSSNTESNTITLTMPDGSTFTRISEEEFAKLTLEEKRAYLATFTQEQQSVFLQNLSPDDYKSLLKQLPVDRKADIINEVTAITEDLGLNLTVDEITNDNLTLSMRNEKGELVAVGSAKDTVANTGYDRRGILALAGAFILAGIAGVYAIVKRCFDTDEKVS